MSVRFDDVSQSNSGGRAMEMERGSYPRGSDAARSHTTPTTRIVAGESSTTETSRAGERAEKAYERAGVVVKDAVNKTREKVAEYREKGFEQVSQDVAEYTRSQPVPALLMAAGVGLAVGMLLRLGRR
jgi:ElaB/YqjD/DUF883 family membrane-anchored ribosome-binding protein